MLPQELHERASRELSLLSSALKPHGEVARILKAADFISGLCDKYVFQHYDERAIRSELLSFLESATQNMPDSIAYGTLLTGIRAIINRGAVLFVLGDDRQLSHESKTQLDSQVRQLAAIKNPLTIARERFAAIEDSFPTTAARVLAYDWPYREVAIEQRMVELGTMLHTIESLTFSSAIIRELEFPPEYQEAAASVLTYFNSHIRKNYPDQEISFKIEQEDLTLRLIINTPEGQKDRIEQDLEKFGLVLTGNIKPEEFAEDRIEVMKLRNRLEVFALQVDQAKRQAALEKDTRREMMARHEREVTDLRNERDSLQLHIRELTRQQHETTQGVLDVAKQAQQNADNQGARSHLEKMSLQDLARELKDLAQGMDDNHVRQYEILVAALTSSQEEEPADELEIQEAVEELQATPAGESLLRRAANKAAEWIIVSGVPQGVNGALAWELLKPWLGIPP